MQQDEYKSVRELTQDELDELKQAIVTDWAQARDTSPSYEELAAAQDIPNEEVFEYYANTVFSAGDFFCNSEVPTLMTRLKEALDEDIDTDDNGNPVIIPSSVANKVYETRKHQYKRLEAYNHIIQWVLDDDIHAVPASRLQTPEFKEAFEREIGISFDDMTEEHLDVIVDTYYSELTQGMQDNAAWLNAIAAFIAHNTAATFL